MIKAIIFDLYGVLALNGWQAFKARHFSDRPDIWNQIFELGRKVDAGLANYDQLIAFTARASNVSGRAVRHELEDTVPNEPLLSYIRTILKPRYKIGLLSNASRNVVPDIFSKADERLFEVIILSHHIGLTKPDIRMYETAARQIDAEPAECLFVDDQERHVSGARDAGMQALVFSGVTQLKADMTKILS